MTLSVRGCEGWVDGPPEVTADTVWPSRAHLTASPTTPPPCCGLGTRSGAPAPGASPIRTLRAEGSRDPASSTAAPTPISGLAGETGPPRQPEPTSCARARRGPSNRLSRRSRPPPRERFWFRSSPTSTCEVIWGLMGYFALTTPGRGTRKQGFLPRPRVAQPRMARPLLHAANVGDCREVSEQKVTGRPVLLCPRGLRRARGLTPRSFHSFMCLLLHILLNLSE